MKLLIVISAILTGSIFLLPTRKNIEGTWILDAEGKECEVTVIRIQMREGYFAGTLDIPEQQVFDRPVAVRVDGDSIRISFDDRGTCFVKAAISDSVLIGTSVVSGREAPARFYRAGVVNDMTCHYNHNLC